MGEGIKKIWPRWGRIQRGYDNCLKLSERLSCRRIRFIQCGLENATRARECLLQRNSLSSLEEAPSEGVSSSSVEVFK